MDEIVKELNQKWTKRASALKSNGQRVAGAAVEQCASELSRRHENWQLFWGTLTKKDFWLVADYSLEESNAKSGGPLPVEQARAVPIIKVCHRLDLAVKRFGKSYRGPCPFHSGGGFSVDTERAIFECFVCGEVGDGIRLVELVRDLTFADAVRELAS